MSLVIHDTMASSDLVAKWDVTLSDKVHRIEFEHGTTTGKRVIRVDGNVCVLLIYSTLSSFNDCISILSMSCDCQSPSLSLVLDLCTFFGFNILWICKLDSINSENDGLPMFMIYCVLVLMTRR